MDSRALAARILSLVLQEKIHLDSACSEIIPATIESREQAFVMELSYGVLRWYYRLDFFLNRLLNKPVRRKDTDIKALILCGLYQLAFLRTPAHAAVSATVNATVHLDKPWAKQLINAVLRRYQRESATIEQTLNNSETALYAHPQWLISALRDDWPGYWQNILNANNQKPPMHLRVNLQKVTRAEYLRLLAASNIEAVPVAGLDCAVSLIQPVDVDVLPGFAQGQVSVQDIGAQHAAALLDLNPGLRVLDACAAPGGKCAHILETQPALASLTAVDRDQTRLKRLGDNCQRLGISLEIYHADAGVAEQWWNGNPFDRILLDVPCSATGVIRRHPDIKVLRQEQSIGNYTDQQYRLLESAWSMLKSRGRLLYATCSVLNQENDQQIAKFLKNYPDASNIDMIQEWGLKTGYGLQILPGIGDADGFYYAVLEKR
ncbi:MAG: 16S rRNA methyltransferase [Gammaproteobacteria bacterium]|nr:16S rRNA methyltransferase [Gammaproteobacteria bacterium]